ncbi:MAG: hypothetical protein KBH06_07575 [Spirochaetes bacterium]|nr:hypothetical protein [Spirochaetota bacterium]
MNKAESSYVVHNQHENYAEEFNDKVKEISEKNKNIICWTSPKRESRHGFPEWAYTRKLEKLYNYLIDAGGYEILDQIGEAYIKAIYDNPKKYGDGKIYQLPERSLLKNADDKKNQWRNYIYILLRLNFSAKFWRGGYIDNIHFIFKNNEIHWDPNNPAIIKGEFDAHCKYDYHRVQTPRPK